MRSQKLKGSLKVNSCRKVELFFVVLNVRARYLALVREGEGKREERKGKREERKGNGRRRGKEEKGKREGKREVKENRNVNNLFI